MRRAPAPRADRGPPRPRVVLRNAYKDFPRLRKAGPAVTIMNTGTKQKTIGKSILTVSLAAFDHPRRRSECQRLGFAHVRVVEVAVDITECVAKRPAVVVATSCSISGQADRGVKS